MGSPIVKLIRQDFALSQLESDTSTHQIPPCAPVEEPVVLPPVELPELDERRLKEMRMFGKIVQLDGLEDTSDEDDDEDKDDDDIDPDGEDEDEGAEEEPLGSEDDISDEDASELFETENVVVCQYDKISRTRNKWKFNLKDGIMNLNGKDYVFSRAHGEAEW